MTEGPDEREGRARYLLGLLLEECGQLSCAALIYGDALRYAPGLTAALVQLAMLAGRRGDYRLMLDYFREAIQRDEAVVREAVRDDPPEVEQLKRILYGGGPEAGSPEVRAGEPTGSEGVAGALRAGDPKVLRERSVPVEVRAGWALLGLGAEQLRRGQDEKAAAALEEALRLDPTSRMAAVVLALAYLLLARRGGTAAMKAEGSLLWEAAPELAGLLFTDEEEGSEVSH